MIIIIMMTIIIILIIHCLYSSGLLKDPVALYNIGNINMKSFE